MGRGKRLPRSTGPAAMIFLGLRTPEAFAAVKALVTGSVSHRDMAAVGARRCVLLEMRDGIAQRFNRARSLGTMPVTFPAVGFQIHIEDIGVLG